MDIGVILIIALVSVILLYFLLSCVIQFKESKNVLIAVYKDKTYYADFGNGILRRSYVTLFPCVLDEEKKAVYTENADGIVVDVTEIDCFKNLMNYKLHKAVQVHEILLEWVAL